MNSDKSAILFLSGKNKPNRFFYFQFLFCRICLYASIRSILCNYQYWILHALSFGQKGKKTGRRMKWKFIIVYYWLADGEGGGRTARVSLETPNTTFNQILLQGETPNQPLLYPYTACSLRFTLQHFPPWIFAN